MNGLRCYHSRNTREWNNFPGRAVLKSLKRERILPEQSSDVYPLLWQTGKIETTWGNWSYWSWYVLRLENPWGLLQGKNQRTHDSLRPPRTMRGEEYNHKWWCLHLDGSEDEAVTELGLLISLRVMDPEVIQGPAGLVLSYQKPRGRNYCNNRQNWRGS